MITKASYTVVLITYCNTTNAPNIAVYVIYVYSGVHYVTENWTLAEMSVKNYTHLYINNFTKQTCVRSKWKYSKDFLNLRTYHCCYDSENIYSTVQYRFKMFEAIRYLQDNNLRHMLLCFYHTSVELQLSFDEDRFDGFFLILPIFKFRYRKLNSEFSLDSKHRVCVSETEERFSPAVLKTCHTLKI